MLDLPWIDWILRDVKACGETFDCGYDFGAAENVFRIMEIADQE